MGLVKESSNLEIEKFHGAETSKNETNLPDISPSPEDGKVEFDAKNDGNATDTSATESKHSDEGIEKPSESDSDDSDENEMDLKVLWLTVLLNESTKLIHM